MLRRLAIVVVLLFAVAQIAPSVAFGQGLFNFGGRDQAQGDQQQPQPVKKKRKTLMDLLFGGDDQEQQAAPPPPVVVKPKKAALPTPPKPAVEKSPTATRLAVFGDTLANDLAGALGRLYQDDPNIIVINQGVPSSGFARPDFFDWNKTAADQVSKNTFDIAVMIAGVNDRQTIKAPDKTSLKVLTPEWESAYQARVAEFVAAFHAASKPLLFVGLPPMSKPEYSQAIGQISSVQRLSVFSGGAEFVDIYDKFVDDDGNYTPTGPDLNGNIVKMRKDDGIRFTNAGADKLAFYVSQTLKLYYHGSGGVGFEVADVLAGTDAAVMVRPPYQGLGQLRLLEVAGAVIPLNRSPKRATDLVSAAAAPTADAGFDTAQMLEAPKGRVDDFGIGKEPAKADDAATGTPAAAATPAVGSPSVMPVAAN
jgi:hypothetical protein